MQRDKRRSPGRPKKYGEKLSRFHLQLPLSTREKLERIAERRKKGMTEVIVTLIEEEYND